MRHPLIYLIFTIVLLTLIGFLTGPIPQPEAYHHFADQRNLWGVTNGWDVFSNLLFAAAGIWGVFLILSKKNVHFIDTSAKAMWLFVAIGLILTAIGSSYYHLNPTNSSLVWDRLPMTIIFMSYVAALIGERINIRLGLFLWPILICFGLYSVFDWYASELRGESDLRLYLGVQLFTILATVIMLFAPSPYNRKWDIALVILLFGLARIFEIYDHEIWDFTRHFISGHTLKHVAAGLAGAMLMYMIANRKEIKHA